MNKKITELTEATQINDDDILMIIQNGENKQITVSKLLPRKQASITLSSTVNANTNYTLPTGIYYEVGNDSLEINYCGSKLIKRTRLQRNRNSRRSIKHNTVLGLSRRFRYVGC